MKEQLIDLMKQWGNENNDSFPFESVADYLVSNGVYVKECNIGTPVYLINNEKVVDAEVLGVLCDCGVLLEENSDGTMLPTSTDVLHLKCKSLTEPSFISVRILGRTAFLTKEEAEEALKGMHNE